MRADRGRDRAGRTPQLMRDNPLSKIPTLILDDSTVLYDLPVICEYLDQLYGPRLIPSELTARMTALRRQALGDGFLDFLLWWRNERERPAEQRSSIHIASYAEKRTATLAALEQEAGALAAAPFSRGHIAIGCALSYLDFRFAADDWRSDHSRLAALACDLRRAPLGARDPPDRRQLRGLHCASR